MEMTLNRFNPEKDLAPIPFDERVCRLALEMKKKGLKWRPHVGCFVWDPEGIIKVASPFPGNVYFILNLPRFIDIFGSVDRITENLVWLPTWYQARILCHQLGITDDSLISGGPTSSPVEDLLGLYRTIREFL